MPTPTQPSESAPAPARPVQASTPTASAAQAAPASGGTGFFVDGREVASLDEFFSSAKDAKDLGFRGGGGGARQRYTSEDVRATTQLSGAITHPRTPAPPTINLDSSEDEQLVLLKIAYRAAHSKTLRTDYWRPAKTQSAKERATLLEAAQALAAEGVSPTAWARFSFYQWFSIGKKTAPGARWVWSAQRIHEHAGWCREAVGGLNSASAPLLPAGKELLQRLGKLQQQLGWGRPTSEVVSEILPERERQVLLVQQERQHEAWQREIQKRIRNGEWVWG